MLFFFFFSSTRRHTRCALVTGVQTCALPIFLVEDPRRTMRIEATGRDLVEHVGEARRIGRVRAAPPQLANGETQRIVEREQSNPSFAPASGALIAPVTLLVHPPHRLAGHFPNAASLPGVDMRGEERQGLPVGA